VRVNLDQVVPWGRSLEEYVRMFDLSEHELELRILDCGGGPAGFNAEMQRRGRPVVSCDPIYRFSAPEIERRIAETSEMIMSKTVETRDNFVWSEMKSPERLREVRMVAMREFLEDFRAGVADGRYRAAELPALPFRDGEFDLALCSHFLFTYSHLLSLEFHLASIRELCRVAGEARVFPLMPNFGDARSEYVEPAVEQLRVEGYSCEIRRVPYEFQKGGNEMLRVLSS
jgi:SAM-dependent methyltransferase